MVISKRWEGKEILAQSSNSTSWYFFEKYEVQANHLGYPSNNLVLLYKCTITNSQAWGKLVVYQVEKWVVLTPASCTFCGMPMPASRWIITLIMPFVSELLPSEFLAQACLGCNFDVYVSYPHQRMKPWVTHCPKCFSVHRRIRIQTRLQWNVICSLYNQIKTLATFSFEEERKLCLAIDELDVYMSIPNVNTHVCEGW